jgi:hypothetical protein
MRRYLFTIRASDRGGGALQRLRIGGLATADAASTASGQARDRR